MTTVKTACTHEKEYTVLKPDPSKWLGMDPGWRDTLSIRSALRKTSYPIMINWFLPKPPNFSPGSLYNPN